MTATPPVPMKPPTLPLTGVQPPVSGTTTRLLEVEMTPNPSFAKKDWEHPSSSMTRHILPGYDENEARRFTGGFADAAESAQRLVAEGKLTKPAVLVQAEDGIWAIGTRSRNAVGEPHDGENTPPVKPVAGENPMYSSHTWTKLDQRVLGVVDDLHIADFRSASKISFDL